MKRKVSDFLVPWITKTLGIAPHDDFNYLTLHIKDSDVHKSMRKYRASRFDQLSGMAFLLVSVNVIHKFILVLMKQEYANFKLIESCLEFIITITWRCLRQTRIKNWACMIVLTLFSLTFATLMLLSTYEVLPAKINVKSS